MLTVQRAPAPEGKDTFLKPLTQTDCAPRKNSALQGHWLGIVWRGKLPLPVSLRIAELAGNTFRAEADVLGIQATNVEATTFSFSRPTVIMEFGELVNVTFEGNLAASGKEIGGMITGGGETWPVTFKRVD